jgi:hypothetical protein
VPPQHRWRHKPALPSTDQQRLYVGDPNRIHGDVPLVQRSHHHTLTHLFEQLT